MVVRAVQMAVWQRSGSTEVILRSDRGGQFISGTYQKFLGGNALVCSMSEVGHCADNAACEGILRNAQTRTREPSPVSNAR